MKKNFASLTLVLLSVAAFMAGCHSSSKATGQTASSAAQQWYKSKQWLNGWQMTPHATVNQQELYDQMQRNSKWWNEAFQFMKTNDLANLKPGTYVIDAGNVTATVTTLVPKTKEETNWEAHRNFNDLQYIITGKTQMGIAPINDPKAKQKSPYEGRSDTEVFTIDDANYYDASPGQFFIFSPKEIHRPAFRAGGMDSIKKIVIKVRVPQANQ